MRHAAPSAPPAFAWDESFGWRNTSDRWTNDRAVAAEFDDPDPSRRHFYMRLNR